MCLSAEPFKCLTSDRLFMEQSLALLDEAYASAMRGRSQECSNGNPFLGAEEYVTAVEKIMAAIDCCPCKDAETRRALQAACRPKLASYCERAQLLLRVAKEEGNESSQLPTSCMPDPQLLLHQQHILNTFQPLGAPTLAHHQPSCDPPASYYLQPCAAGNTEQPAQGETMPQAPTPSSEDGLVHDPHQGSASFDRLFQEFMRK